MVQIPVDGSGDIIHHMKNLILENISLWDNGKEEEFIQDLTKKIPIDHQKIIERYNYKLEPLDKERLEDKVFRFLLMLSEIISEIQKRSTNELVGQIKSELTTTLNVKEIQQRLDILSQSSDVDFSLLINLGILCKYAKIIGKSEPIEYYNDYFVKVINSLKKQ